MRTIIKYFYLFLVLIILFGCADSEVDSAFIASLKDRPAHVDSLSVSDSQLFFSFAKETQSVNVKASDSFTVSSSQDWIEATVIGTNVNITVAQNTSSILRNGYVTVSLNETQLAERISIIQEGDNRVIQLDPSSFDLNAKKQDIKLKVTVDSSWILEIPSSVTWISSDTKSGNTSKEVVLHVLENNSLDDRQTTINVKTSDQVISSPVSIVQRGKGLSLSADELKFHSDKETHDIMVLTDYDFSVSTNASWLSYSIDGKTISITASASTDPETRTAIVYVYLNASNGSVLAVKELKVSQDGIGYHLELSQESISTSYNAFSTTITINANEDWDISVSDSWFTVSQTYGSGDTIVTVNVEANTNTATREGTITVTGQHTGRHSISVKQTGSNSIDFGDFGSEENWD